MTQGVCCVGIAVLDRVYEIAALPSGGGKHVARGYRETGGGMAATAALAVARLGGRGIWCGPLGDDVVGRDLRQRLDRGGVDTGPAQVLPGVRTPISVVLVQPDGERCLILDRDPRLEMHRPEIPPGTAAVMADPRFPRASLAALHSARDRGIPGVLDAEVAATAALPALLAAASHPVFSRAALRELTGEADPGAGLRRVGHGCAGVTLGPEGSLFLIEGRLHAVPAPRIAARDTTGCGDVFHGAFALGLAAGMPVLAAARLATAAAALKAEAGRGWDGIPGRAAADAMLARGWSARNPTHALRVNAASSNERPTMSDASRDDAKQKLWAMMKDIKFAMLTTDDAGHLRARPMAASQTGFDGTLWFFTRASSHKVAEVGADHSVGVTYADPSGQNYVSLSGRATLVQDKASIAAHWSEGIRTWFPKGQDDPDIALLKVDVKAAEYWDAPNSAMVHAYGYIKAVVTGESPHPGENRKVSFP